MGSYRRFRHDALEYLRPGSIIEYPKGTVIYSGGTQWIYLVIQGRVKISTLRNSGSETLGRIVGPEALFGECGLIRGANHQKAESLDRVDLMRWSIDEIATKLEQEPAFRTAFVERIVDSLAQLRSRITAMAVMRTGERIATSLIELAEALGSKQEDGGVEMPTISHAILAEHVGTSREIVTVPMCRLRNAGMVRYSRKQITVYCDELRRAFGKGLIRADSRPISIRTGAGGIVNEQGHGSHGNRTVELQR